MKSTRNNAATIPNRATKAGNSIDCDTQPLRASRPAAAAASRSGAGGPLAVSWSTSAQGMPPGPP
ncbi:hypothetical protein FVP45_11890, partial [Mycobacterium tuberculosis]|nr:hypothetical protein [Mycobacterium tuberculosis]